MTKQTATTQTAPEDNETCQTCRGYSAQNSRCRANRLAGPCELYRTRPTREEAMSLIKRREELEAYHVMGIFDDLTGNTITITEDDGPERGMHRAKLMIDLLIAEAKMIAEAEAARHGDKDASGK